MKVIFQRFQAGQQPVEGVVRRRLGLDVGRFRAGERRGRSQQELDVVFGLYFGGVPTLHYAPEKRLFTICYLARLRNSYIIKNYPIGLEFCKCPDHPDHPE